MIIQSGAVITRSNITSTCIQHWGDYVQHRFRSFIDLRYWLDLLIKPVHETMHLNLRGELRSVIVSIYKKLTALWRCCILPREHTAIYETDCLKRKSFSSCPVSIRNFCRFTKIRTMQLILPWQALAIGKTDLSVSCVPNWSRKLFCKLLKILNKNFIWKDYVELTNFLQQGSCMNVCNIWYARVAVLSILQYDYKAEPIYGYSDSHLG